MTLQEQLTHPSDPTEEQIVGPIAHSFDDRADFWGHQTYVWYWRIGKKYQPKTLVEIGTRFGYSLRAMFLGSIEGYGISRSVAPPPPRNLRAYTFDDERDHSGSNDYTRAHMATLGVDMIPTKINTRELKSLNLPEQVDLGHVDGDHTTQGAYEDCGLVWEAIRPGGIMVVDDIKAPLVKEGVDRWCAEKGIFPEYLECYRGLYLIAKQK